MSPRVSLLLAILCLPLVVGCEGCRRDDDEAQQQKEKEAPLDDFTARPPSVFPADSNSIGGGIKPGHWITASQPLKSNKMDARGELVSRTSASGVNFQTSKENFSKSDTPTVRPVVLPKGQLRKFDFRILTPVPANSDQKRGFISSSFVSSGRSVFFDTGRQPFSILSGEEFFFVILTGRPERFAKFQVSDWVRPFRDEAAFRSQGANYRIVIPPIDDLLPLSETMLDWTGTAVLFWDDLSPDALTPQQQVAIADWVRFGGLLIVNGAIASDAVSKTSLAELLPLEPSGNIELDPDAATKLLRGWSVPTDRSTEKQIAVLTNQTARVAVDGRANPDTVALPNSANLLLERRIGSGRVIQPRFDVTSDWITNWESYDSFVNSALLGRPPRQFVKSNDLADGSEYRHFYPDTKSTLADAAMNSRFRISARDAILKLTDDKGGGSNAASSRLDSLTAVDSSTGISGWTDHSDTIAMCRQILRNESGIEIPSSSLVVRSLGYYLLLLVPINYLVFRLMGKLEYAWLAVPVIAIGGAIWVARAARLDIGFARSQTEIAVLELQPKYQRGHLSRVTAIYNSLSSSYDVEFKTVDAAAAPIIRNNASENRGGTTFKTGFAEGPILSGLAVGSNQVRMLHTEQIIDVGGPIYLDDSQRLINQTSHELYDAFVVEKSAAGEVRIAMVGGCAAGSTAKLRFRDVSKPSITGELPMQTARMIRHFGSPASMPNGSTRLIARIDESMPGMTITPIANQTTAQTIVLAHLIHAPLPEHKMDLNLLSDMRRVLSDKDETK